MSAYRRLELKEVGDVTVVYFRDQKIIEDLRIQELGQELFQLVETEKRKKLLLNFFPRQTEPNNRHSPDQSINW